MKETSTEKLSQAFQNHCKHSVSSLSTNSKKKQFTEFKHYLLRQKMKKPLRSKRLYTVFGVILLSVLSVSCLGSGKEPVSGLCPFGTLFTGSL